MQTNLAGRCCHVKESTRGEGANTSAGLVVIDISGRGVAYIVYAGSIGNIGSYGKYEYFRY